MVQDPKIRGTVRPPMRPDALVAALKVKLEDERHVLDSLVANLARGQPLPELWALLHEAASPLAAGRRARRRFFRGARAGHQDLPEPSARRSERRARAPIARRTIAAGGQAARRRAPARAGAHLVGADARRGDRRSRKARLA